MGREVRMVPPEWQHPKNERGHDKPLLDGSFSEALAEWELGNAKWAEGLVSDYNGDWEPKDADLKSETYEDYSGGMPKEEDYMPAFTEGTATHLMMYENTSEGTPISPAFATPEELAHWLADTNASAFGDQGASYEGWLRVCKGGYAPSAVLRNDGRGIVSGVEAMTEG